MPKVCKVKALQKLARQICKKKVRAKLGELNVQKEYTQKSAREINKKSTRKNWHVKSAKKDSVKICRFSSCPQKQMNTDAE